jgi:hypothetical protein
MKYDILKCMIITMLCIFASICFTIGAVYVEFKYFMIIGFILTMIAVLLHSKILEKY